MITLFIAAALASDASSLDSAEWTEAGTRRGVALHKATVDDTLCVQGTLTTPVSPDALLAVTDRMVTSPEWSQADLTHSEELSRDDDGFVLHQHFNSPGWTLSADRFWIVRGEPTRHSATHSWYRWTRVDSSEWPQAAATSRALAASAIEMPTNYGEWDFHQTGEQTQVRYRACADIGGGTPQGIVTWLTTRQVPTLITELVEEAGQ